MGVVVVGYVRTPVGKFGGALKDVKTPHLAAFTIKKLLERVGLEGKLVEEVVFGSTLQGGMGQNLSRYAALLAGLPVEVSAYTVNRVCSSGMQAVIEAYREIALGDASVVVAAAPSPCPRRLYASHKTPGGACGTSSGGGRS
jgi:Acetyl-CoA acetyltransferase